MVSAEHNGLKYYNVFQNIIERQEKYPVSHLAFKLGIAYKDQTTSPVYKSDWSPLAIKEKSLLGELLSLPFMNRLKGVGQLGPHREKPYTYSHTVFDHTAEQLARGISRLAHMSESQSELFMKGTSAYYDGKNTEQEHIEFILKVASCSILLHDAESLPLRDTAKMAFKTPHTETDENEMLVAHLNNRLDRKYLPFLREVFGERTNEVIGILTRIAKREEDTFLGDFLHSKSLPDDSDPSGKSRPLDLDRITYTIQDLMRVFGAEVFDPTLLEERSGTSTLFLSRMFYKLADLVHVESEIAKIKGYMVMDVNPPKINPQHMDLICDAMLGETHEGRVTIGYRKPEKVLNFLKTASLENFPTLYFNPAMIFTEVMFMNAIQKRFSSLPPEMQNQMLVEISSWPDSELLRWLNENWPECAKNVRDDQYDNYYYLHSYIDKSSRPKRSVVEIPVHIHPATSTGVITGYNTVVPIGQLISGQIAEFRKILKLYDDRYLSINRSKRKLVKF